MKRFILILAFLIPTILFAQKKEKELEFVRDTITVSLSKLQEEKLIKLGHTIDSLQVAYIKMVTPLQERQRDNVELALDKGNVLVNEVESMQLLPGKLVVIRKRIKSK